MRLIIDIGNTLVKYALFNNDKLLQLSKKNEVDHNYINQIISKNSVNSVIVSSVRKKIDWNVNTKLVVLNHTTKLPITINYETPKTLGNDRIANVVAASVLYPNKNILVIDAGTCITFDLIDLNKVFLGGRISPGIEMRYKSLYEFTDNLPKITFHSENYFIGKSTKESIISGVQQGVLSEIKLIISDLKKENEDLIVIVTGGDAFFFDKALKNSIFADQNLVLKGLNEILKYNE
tara:strand:+ start:1312 stop:2016 length:705 start_codon:yes stop_codon:yes gene_type:complete